MKELRLEAADGVWRFAFAFDPKRRAMILCGGDKSGVSEKRFYRQLINKADARFDAHVAKLKREKQQGKEVNYDVESRTDKESTQPDASQED